MLIAVHCYNIVWADADQDLETEIEVPLEEICGEFDSVHEMLTKPDKLYDVVREYLADEHDSTVNWMKWEFVADEKW